jgi:hypothetical protein
LEDITVHAGRKVLIEIDDTNALILGNPLGILASISGLTQSNGRGSAVNRTLDGSTYPG